MQPSNALAILEDIFSKAVESGHKDQSCAHVLLTTMKLPVQPENLIDFYDLLSKASEEAKSLTNIPKIDIYIKAIENLNHIFIANHAWGAKWEIFREQIENKNIRPILYSLARELYSRNPTIPLNEDFLSNLHLKFQEILDEILNSGLPKDLVKLLVQRIEDILNQIRRYKIDGSVGLERAIKVLVVDLISVEPNLQKTDKENRIYKKVQVWAALLVQILSVSSIFIGGIPDIYNFWIPEFRELIRSYEQIEKVVAKDASILEILRAAAKVLNNEQTKSITGVEQKALPPASEDLEGKSQEDDLRQ